MRGFTPTCVALLVAVGLVTAQLPPAGPGFPPIAGFPADIVAEGDKNLCLTAESNTLGSPVILAQCILDLANRSWNVTQGGATSGTGPVTTLNIFGDKCLDVKNGVDADGTRLQIWTCSEGNRNQMFEYNSDFTIRWAGTNKCVDNTGGVLKDGNPTQIWTCAGNSHQQWPGFDLIIKELIPIAVTTFFKTISELVSQCVTATNNSNGAPVVLEECIPGVGEGGPGQEWSIIEGGADTGLGPIGAIQVFDNMCLDVTDGNTANGVRMQVWECGKGNKNQLFQYNGDSTIRWANQGKCVDLTGGNLANGTVIQSWDCIKFNHNQQWITQVEDQG